jgi:hypothetical protein
MPAGQAAPVGYIIVRAVETSFAARTHDLPWKRSGATHTE